MTTVGSQLSTGSTDDETVMKEKLSVSVSFNNSFKPSTEVFYANT